MLELIKTQGLKNVIIPYLNALNLLDRNRDILTMGCFHCERDGEAADDVLFTTTSSEKKTWSLSSASSF